MQEMELTNILDVLRRRIILLVAVPTICVVALVLGLRASPAVYEAGVRLQLSTPQREDVAVFDEYRSISLRDEITVASNNFTQVLQSDEVRDRTIAQLALQERDQEYELSVSPDRDSDFINVTVQARTADLAPSIADAHVDAAIRYYGELRARPINAEKDLFAEELRTAEQEFSAAEDAYAAFQAQQGIGSLEQELETQQRLLEQLKVERDVRILDEISRGSDPVGEVETLISWRQEELKRLLALEPTYEALTENVQKAQEEYTLLVSQNGLPAVTATQPITDGVDSAELIARTGDLPPEVQVAEEKLRTAQNLLNEFKAQNGIVTLDSELATHSRLLEQLRLERDRLLLEETTRAVDPLAEVDRLIAERQAELDRLTALVPRYNVLVENAQQARDAYQRILSKYTEAELKAATVQAANFIQVVQPAQADANPVSDLKKLLFLAVVGSVGLSVLLAFVLEYFPGPVLAPIRARTGGRSAPSLEEQENPGVVKSSSALVGGPKGDQEKVAGDAEIEGKERVDQAHGFQGQRIREWIRDLRGWVAGHRFAAWILVAALVLVLLVYGSSPLRTGGSLSASVPTAPSAASATPVAPTVSISTQAMQPARTPTPVVAQVSVQNQEGDSLVPRCTPPDGWMIYVVRGSDTLDSLAAKYEVSVADILQANCMSGGEISQFQTLYLPPLPNTDTLASAPQATATVPMTSTVPPQVSGCVPPEGWTDVYVVRSGDNLYSLALVHDVTVEQIMTANCLESTFLSAGRQALYLPPLPEGSTASSVIATLPGGSRATSTPETQIVRQLFPAPVLSAPADVAEFQASARIVLRWQPVPNLLPDAYYAVSVAYSHNGATWYDEVPWTRDTSWTLSEHSYLLDLSDDGEFRWSVQVVRQVRVDTEGGPVGEPLSEPSVSRTLNWKRPTSGGGRAPGGTPPVPPP